MHREISIESEPFRPAMAARARAAVLRQKLERSEPLDAVVVGAGASGLAAIELLERRGARVKVADDRDYSSLAAEAQGRIREADFGPITEARLEGAELVVLSPGVPLRRPELRAAVDRGVLFGEIEVASWVLSGPMIGITGTNGKSTTTALVGHLLAQGGFRTFVGGNLGPPLSSLASSGRQVDVAVVELSSYQLESIVTARFAVGCWLNLTPDHTDRYDSVSTYAGAKARLLESRQLNGIGVLNAKDPYCADLGIRLGRNIRWFAAEEHSDLAGPLGTLLVSEDRARRTSPEGVEEYRLHNPALPGKHNLANMCAAIECVRHLELSPERVQSGLDSFPGLPHRLQQVAELDGVRWVNDSKATNVDSAATALRALPGPKILIAGGKDKGASWDELRGLAREVRAVLAIGQAAPLVVRCFAGAVGVVETLGTLEAAVKRARELARPGDTVLLSPACASFDQFENYEARGRAFEALVQKLGQGRG